MRPMPKYGLGQTKHAMELEAVKRLREEQFKSGTHRYLDKARQRSLCVGGVRGPGGAADATRDGAQRGTERQRRARALRALLGS